MPMALFVPPFYAPEVDYGFLQQQQLNGRDHLLLLFFFPEVRTYTMATDRSGQVELLLRTRKQIRGKGLWIKANEVRTRGGLKISKSGKQGLPPFPSTPLPLPACIGHTFQPCPSPTSLISSCHCSASLTKRNVDSKIDKHFSVGKLS